MTAKQVSNFSAVAGGGVGAAMISGRRKKALKRICWAAQNFSTEQGIATESLAPQAQKLRLEGDTVVFVAVGGELIGIIGVADPIKKTTENALRKLRAEGLKIVMLTGDNKTTAEAVARNLEH